VPGLIEFHAGVTLFLYAQALSFPSNRIVSRFYIHPLIIPLIYKPIRYLITQNFVYPYNHNEDIHQSHFRWPHGAFVVHSGISWGGLETKDGRDHSKGSRTYNQC
jgi:hypothetical protein